MLYVGIDIGKRNHEATILDESGKELCESIKFFNSNEGVDKLLSKISNQKMLFLALKLRAITGYLSIATSSQKALKC